MYRNFLPLVLFAVPVFAQGQIDTIDGSTDGFGQSVDIVSFETGDELDVMVVGNQEISELNFYEREADSFDWTLVQTFAIPSPTSKLGFDVEVDYQESTGEYHVIAGAPGTQERAYVFTRDSSGFWNGSGSTLILQGGIGPDIDFGSAVDVDFNGSQPIAVVGAPKANTVYCFRKQGGVWNLTQTIVNPSTLATSRFGTTVAYDDNMLAIGSPGENNEDGRVWTYDLVGSTFVADNIIDGQADSAADGGFGLSLDLEKDLMVVGAPGIFGGAGQIQIFRKNTIPGAAFWLFEQALTSNTPGLNDRFGTSVDIGPNETVAVGTPFYEDAGLASDYDHGAAYVYEFKTLGWNLQYEFQGPMSTIPGDTEDDQFGFSIALDHQFLAVGRPRAIGSNGSMDIFSTESIIKSKESIDKTTGGSQVLLHAVDPAFIGDTYFMVGSLSPTFVYDTYTELTIQNANGVAFVNTLGTVGFAAIKSTINIPSNINQPVSLYHTFFILEPGTVNVNSMSESEVLEIF